MKRQLRTLSFLVLTAGWATAVAATSQYATTILADHPVVYYRLGEAPGSTVAPDTSGNGHVGAYFGGVTLGQQGALAGDSDTSVSFDGSTGYVNSGFDVFSPSSTIEAWIRPTRPFGPGSDNGTGQELIAATSGLGGLLFGRNSAGQAWNFIWTGSWNSVNTPPLPLNTWTYLAATWDDTTKQLSIYVNGTLSATTTLPGASAIDQLPGSPFLVGGLDYGGGTLDQMFQGGIDEVAYYNYALTDNQILAHYNAGTNQDTTGPLTTNVQATPDPVAINSSSTLNAHVDDTSTGNSNTASAQYTIDGSPFFPMNAADSTYDHPAEDVTALVPGFSSTGVYNLCVRGTDAAGNTGATTCTMLPVYDPSAGFVTGGGGIDSPAGKDLVNTSAAGPATFGFVSRYQKGASTPSGNLEFQFKAGNLTFHSTSMDWLVVTGQPRAQFQGTGTINGTGVCKYQVDAWDNSFPSANGLVDAFGIKIYACNSGGDANGNRYSIDATPLSKGSIIIHK